MSKILSKYDIHIQGLENKRYTYEFEGGDEFFEFFEQDIITKGHFKATVILDKNSTLMQLWFDIEGVVELTCDRCLEPFEEPVHVKEKYIYKFGDRHEELSDEIEMIPLNTATVNIAQHIYDFIGVSLPMKKLHPKFRNEADDEEDEFIYSTDKEEAEQEEEEVIDPRWAALLSLKNQKNKEN
ncbi:YceD family protein [Emticicia sp. 17c]|uniref:YceD family protein n=1 Tax=Emticicia sp. 17c TaxID=3127704 RepID=UPI00301E5F7D